MRELLESYMGNRFKLMLETLERYSVRSPLPLVPLYSFGDMCRRVMRLTCTSGTT